jgi:hypothetical protein
MFEWGVVFWLAVVLPLLAIGIVIEVFFLLNLRDVLRSVSLQNRAMEPNQVWLNFIPLFGIVWIFVTVIKIRDSVRAEFYSRRWAASGDFGYGVGLAYAILSIISWGFLGIAALVCYVMYWVRMSELKNQLGQSQPPVGWINAPTGVIQHTRPRRRKARPAVVPRVAPPPVLATCTAARAARRRS